MSTSLLSSFKKPPYLDYEGTNPSDNEERVKTSQDVPEDKEDGGEVVEDDSGAENDEGAAEYGQEGVQRHDAVGASVGLLRLSGKN